VCRGLRETDDVLEVGDLAIHGEEAYPEETNPEEELAELVGAYSMAGVASGSYVTGQRLEPSEAGGSGLVTEQGL
jgi:hypothetical protein